MYTVNSNNYQQSNWLDLPATTDSLQPYKDNHQVTFFSMNTMDTEGSRVNVGERHGRRRKKGARRIYLILFSNITLKSSLNNQCVLFILA